MKVPHYLPPLPVPSWIKKPLAVIFWALLIPVIVIGGWLYIVVYCFIELLGELFAVSKKVSENPPPVKELAKNLFVLLALLLMAGGTFFVVKWTSINIPLLFWIIAVPVFIFIVGLPLYDALFNELREVLANIKKLFVR